jgi:hypothetical protein
MVRAPSTSTTASQPQADVLVFARSKNNLAIREFVRWVVEVLGIIKSDERTVFWGAPTGH